MPKKAMDVQYEELRRLSDLLKSYVDSYRLLVAGAAELNNIYGRKDKEVKSAINRVDAVGEKIDEIMDVINKHQHNYLKYSKIKNDVVFDSYTNGKAKNGIKSIIQTEIDTELNLFNDTANTIRDEDE
ncbi:hypothetical protein [Clostridium sp.]|uniref:hypothetical protein n=1 Tax=Clostridium sp. TaxID=1506 RepID=UPI0026DB027A|nr:hypothetical protein [Clostridium sp.]MDO5039137.1 hypothetical protein [Clostridium sp.]